MNIYIFGGDIYIFWLLYLFYFEEEKRKTAAHHCGRKQIFPKQVCPKDQSYD